MIKIGDFVTGYDSGYWQLIDIKPKVSDEDYAGEKLHWKKGEIIGQWAILKKCFTVKMKPRIDFSYEDFAWVKPVSNEIRVVIENYFEEHPEYKLKFEQAEVKLQPIIMNCWLDLPEEKESDFKNTLKKLPNAYTMDNFWMIAKNYKKFVAMTPAKYLLNLFTYPWHKDENANTLYSSWELTKL